MARRVTSKPVGTKASRTLSSGSTGKASKTAGASALAQRSPPKHTSQKAASASSQVLRDGRTSAQSKSAAGSTLSQRGGSRTGKGKK